MDKTVESLCTGGFVLDVEFSATRLRELCKLDGAVIVDRDITKILRAGVQLVPDPAIPTEETCTGNRTADRSAARSTSPWSRSASRCADRALRGGPAPRAGGLRGDPVPRETRRWPRWSGTSCGWTRWRARLSALEIEDW